jgi:hypothetical protein
VSAQPLEWGNASQLAAASDGGPFAFVLGADLLYSSSSPFFPALLDSLEAVMAQAAPPRILLAHPVGRDSAPAKVVTSLPLRPLDKSMCFTLSLAAVVR